MHGDSTETRALHEPAHIAVSRGNHPLPETAAEHLHNAWAQDGVEPRVTHRGVSIGLTDSDSEFHVTDSY